MLYKTNKYQKEWLQFSQDQAWDYFFQILPQPNTIDKNNCPVYMFAHASAEQHDISTITDIYAIMLDYEDGTTPEQFVRQYPDLQYYWYTSRSHTPESPRFRVVLPLMEPIDYQQIHNPQAKAALQDYFPGNDGTSYTNLQCVPNRGDYYSWGYNIGEYYSLSRLRKQIAESPALSSLPNKRTYVQEAGEYKHVDDWMSYATAVRKAHLERLALLPRSSGHSSYGDYCSLVGTMLRVHANGMWIWQVQEIMDIVYSRRPEKNIAKMIQEFASRRPLDAPQKPTTKSFSQLGH